MTIEIPEDVKALAERMVTEHFPDLSLGGPTSRRGKRVAFSVALIMADRAARAPADGVREALDDEPGTEFLKHESVSEWAAQAEPAKPSEAIFIRSVFANADDDLTPMAKAANEAEIAKPSEGHPDPDLDQKHVRYIAMLRHECAYNGPCADNGDGCTCSAVELGERQQRRATLSPPVQAEAGWQDISVVPPPKDGTDFLAWLGGGQQIIHWFAPWQCWMRRGDDPDHPEAGERYGIGSRVPTDWRPLPAPPPLKQEGV